MDASSGLNSQSDPSVPPLLLGQNDSGALWARCGKAERGEWGRSKVEMRDSARGYKKVGECQKA